MVSKLIEYGEDMSSDPISIVSSSLNCTPATEEIVSVAVAETVTEIPETVELSDGAVTETLGTVLSNRISFVAV